MTETGQSTQNHGIQVRPVTRYRIRNLKKLFAERIHSIPHVWVNQDDEAPVQTVAQYLSSWGIDAAPFKDWFEAIDTTGQRVGGLLVSPNIDNLARFCTEGINGVPPEPEWLGSYVTETFMIDDIVVSADHEREGIGTVLFEHAAAEAHRRGARRLIAGTVSEEAAAFLAAQGMTVGELGQPIPAEVNAGVPIGIRQHQRGYARWAWKLL